METRKGFNGKKKTLSQNTKGSNIAEQEAEIVKPSNMVNSDKDLILAEEDDSTNIDSQNSLINGKFDKNIKLVGNK